MTAVATTTRTRTVSLIVNARASGVDSARSVLRDASAALTRAGADVNAVATGSLADLAAAIEDAAGSRVVLVGGDGAVHAAANAGIAADSLALLPAGRANNIAHGLGIPVDWEAAARVAVSAEARPLDLLSVSAGGRELLAVEGFSAGFHAAARARYSAENSADLRQGVAALAGELARYRPYEIELELDGAPIGSCTSAQLFVSNLPLFGFGFQVAPRAVADDGYADVVRLGAPRSRLGVLRELARVRNGTHLDGGRTAATRARHVAIRSPLPLVADAEPLGVSTAEIAVVPGALALARPRH